MGRRARSETPSKVKLDPAGLQFIGTFILISSSLIAFVVLILLAILVLVSDYPYSRSIEILDEWARVNHYQILSREERHFRRGPFTWTMSRVQTVFYVVIHDELGRKRSGWVRCGNWSRGLVKNEVEVIWEN
jgi:hypothetical protein